MPQVVSEQEVARVLAAQWTIRTPYRDINVMTPTDAKEITKLLNEYLVNHPDNEFVGMPHFAKSRKHVCLDVPDPSFWHDSATGTWSQTFTGKNTLDAVWPDSASQVLKLDSPPDHQLYFAGVMELGTLNALNRVYLADLNGAKMAKFSCWAQSRMSGAPRDVRMIPSLIVRERGTIAITAEGIAAGTSEMVPIASHIFPQEIAVNTSLAGYVTAG